MQDGQKFNNTLWDHSRPTPWMKCDARWSEIQQHLVRPQSTHELDKMWCEMVRNSTTPCKTTVYSLSGQNVMWNGQKFNITLLDNGQLTDWTKCDVRWSEIQQHLVRQWSTHELDEMWCEMVRNSTTPCKTMVDSQTGRNVMWDDQKFKNTLQDDGQLTNWMKSDVRWSEIQEHLARRRSTHQLDKTWCEMVRTPCETTVDSQTGQNVMWDGQKFNNTLQDDGRLTNWTKCDVRWSEIQQHLARRQLTHSLDRISHHMIHYLMPLVILQHLPARNHILLASSQRGYYYLSLYFPIFIQYQPKLSPCMPLLTYYDIHALVGSKNPLIIPHSHPSIILLINLRDCSCRVTFRSQVVTTMATYHW